MPSILCESLCELDVRMDAGDRAGAKELAADLLDRVSPESPEWSTLLTCLDAIESLDPESAANKLRWLWHTAASAELREIITLCGTLFLDNDVRVGLIDTNPDRHRTTADDPDDHDVAPGLDTGRTGADDLYDPPAAHRVELRAAQRIEQRYNLYGLAQTEAHRTGRSTSTESQPTRPADLRWHLDYTTLPPEARGAFRVVTEVNPSVVRTGRPQTLEPMAVIHYVTDRLGIDDAPELTAGGHLDRYDGSTITDQYTAPAPLGTLPCVSCHLERRRADETRTASTDDGLCTDCRSAQRPGIPRPRRSTTPAYVSTRTAQVHGRCAWIAERHPRAARTMLAALARQSSGIDRDAIRAWTRTHLTPASDAPEQAPITDNDQAADAQRRADICASVVRLAQLYPLALDTVIHSWTDADRTARAGIARARHELLTSGEWAIHHGALTRITPTTLAAA